jgi:ribosome-binding protein aMBF1 (putative translation factor)
MAKKRDFLDEMIDEWTAKDPNFPRLLKEAERRRRMGRRLAKARKAKKLSQKTVAERMSTTQSVVSRLESGADVQLSTLLRYVDVVGFASLAIESRPTRKKQRAR